MSNDSDASFATGEDEGLDDLALGTDFLPENYVSAEALPEGPGPLFIGGAVCPITAAIFVDPVVLHASGHTYER